MKNITVLIPCYNEEKGISDVIKGIPHKKLEAFGYKAEVIVIDNNSNDKTVKKAASKGVKIITEKKQGKGHAVITGFKSLPKNTDIVIILDGDNTYLSREMLRMIEPLDSKFCDVVIGTRLGGKVKGGSMPTMNRWGNWFFTFIVRTAYKTSVTDVCTGYFAFNKNVADFLAENLESKGFSLEMEMVTKMARMNYEIYSVPITYQERRFSESKLRPFKDGINILKVWAKDLRWKPNKSRKVKKV